MKLIVFTMKIIWIVSPILNRNLFKVCARKILIVKWPNIVVGNGLETSIAGMRLINYMSGLLSRGQTTIHYFIIPVQLITWANRLGYLRFWYIVIFMHSYIQIFTRYSVLWEYGSMNNLRFRIHAHVWWGWSVVTQMVLRTRPFN